MLVDCGRAKRLRLGGTRAVCPTVAASPVDQRCQARCHALVSEFIVASFRVLVICVGVPI